MKFDPALPRDGVNVSRTHPLREAFVLIFGVLAIAAVAAASIGVVVDWLAPRIPPALEESLFAEWFADDERAEPESRQLALEALLGRLVVHWPDCDYTFRVRVWDESQPNALALPGGHIAVTSGLLDRVESENELAFVLGHELGHFHNRDHLRGLGRGVGLSLLFVALGIGGGGGAAQLASTAADLTQRGFSRRQESTADAFGLGLVAAEYGHTAGAADLFDHIAPDGGAPSDGLSGYLSTHPLHSDRVQGLRAVAAKAGWPLRGERIALPGTLLPARE